MIGSQDIVIIEKNIAKGLKIIAPKLTNMETKGLEILVSLSIIYQNFIKNDNINTSFVKKIVIKNLRFPTSNFLINH